MSTLYMKASPEQISKYVIFSGDPWRVNVFKDLLEDIELVGFEREYNTLTGTYQGVRVTATSTGIGAPSAAIAMEEMYDCGMEVAIRMGTVMSLDDSMVGEFLIPLGSMRGESTSDYYVDKSYPAIADFELVQVLNEAVARNGYKYRNSVHCTLDGYYTSMKTSRFADQRGVNPDATFEELAELKVLGVDMESSAMLVIGRLMGIKAGVITLATVSKNLNAKLEDAERKHMEEMLCKVTLDAIVQLDKKSKA